MKLRRGGLFFEHFNHFRFLIVLLSLGVMYIIIENFKLENYNWLYALPICLHFIFPQSFNPENYEDSERDKL